MSIIFWRVIFFQNKFKFFCVYLQMQSDAVFSFVPYSWVSLVHVKTEYYKGMFLYRGKDNQQKTRLPHLPGIFEAT